MGPIIRRPVPRAPILLRSDSYARKVSLVRKFPVLILDFLLYSCHVELRHLRYFVAVAEHLSFTKAAGKLRVAQPVLSRQVRQLEDELGVKLLERNRRSVALTDAGSAFLAEA